MFVTKYGNMNKAIPTKSGTTAFCFLPYMKYPRPIAPNSIPQISNDVPSILTFSDYFLLTHNAWLSGAEMHSIFASGGGLRARNVLERFVMLLRIQCAALDQVSHVVWPAKDRNDPAWRANFPQTCPTPLKAAAPYRD